MIGRGWTQAGGRPHAEAAALGLAGEAARGSTVFVTLEPCAHESERGPSCADLLAAAGPETVVIGANDPDPRTAGSGIKRLRDAGINVRAVDCPEAKRSLDGYLTRQSQGRPHVTLKLAVSLDGKIALADGRSRWITGEPARAHVHARRAKCDAILVGGGTWRGDKPRLDVRLPGLEDRSPKRIVLTRGIAPDGVKIINSPEQISKLTDIQYLYVEGGAETAAAFLSADLVDHLEIYQAPILIGEGQDAIADLGLAELPQAHGRWRSVESRQLGSDLYRAYDRLR